MTSSSPTLPGAQSPYWISSALDIRQQFCALQRRAERIFLSRGAGLSIVSSVLNVDERGGLLLDVGPDDISNQQLLAASVLHLHGCLDGVELQCEVGPLQWTRFEGLPAFSCPAPRRLHRLQRRDYHRVAIPAGQQVRCLLPASSEHAAPLPATVLDVSLGGLRLLQPDAASAPPLQPGDILPNVRVDLGEPGHFSADLEVRHHTYLITRTGQEQHKVGVCFSKLPARAEQLLQRYVLQLERDQRALQSPD